MQVVSPQCIQIVTYSTTGRRIRDRPRLAFQARSLAARFHACRSRARASSAWASRFAASLPRRLLRRSGGVLVPKPGGAPVPDLRFPPLVVHPSPSRMFRACVGLPFGLVRPRPACAGVAFVGVGLRRQRSDLAFDLRRPRFLPVDAAAQIGETVPAEPYAPRADVSKEGLQAVEPLLLRADRFPNLLRPGRLDPALQLPGGGTVVGRVLVDGSTKPSSGSPPGISPPTATTTGLLSGGAGFRSWRARSRESGLGTATPTKRAGSNSANRRTSAGDRRIPDR